MDSHDRSILTTFTALVAVVEPQYGVDSLRDRVILQLRRRKR
jgi:hypothetical protein